MACRNSRTTARWSGEPLQLRYRVSVDAAREAYLAGRPLELEVELPLVANVYKAKEFIRDDAGRPEAVIEKPFVDLRWDAGAAKARSEERRAVGIEA